jgi:DNA-nicking Smr family endonuclease
MSNDDATDEDDSSLFRRSIGKVRPVSKNVVISLPGRPKPKPKHRDADEQQALSDMATGFTDPEHLETGEELYFKRDGVQSRLFQKLKRGQIRVEKELDLHGMISTEAKKEISQFLAFSKTANIRCIRIIHGKGKGSREGVPVLKGKVNHWLQQRDDVLAFCSARQMDGGTGAVYVLLKKKKGNI